MFFFFWHWVLWNLLACVMFAVPVLVIMVMVRLTHKDR